MDAAKQAFVDLPAWDSLLDVTVDQQAAKWIPWTLPEPRLFATQHDKVFLWIVCNLWLKAAKPNRNAEASIGKVCWTYQANGSYALLPNSDADLGVDMIGGIRETVFLQ